MSISPTSIKHDQLILQAFEESLSFWNQLRVDVEEHFKNGNPFNNPANRDISDVPRYIHRTMTEHLAAQDQRVKTIASSGQYIIYSQAQYALAALIDDQLLRSVSWPHQSIWLTMLLEKTFYSSRNAGHTLIQRIEDLVESISTGTSSSSQIKQLAYIYLTVFWQGFRGKLINNPQKLEHLISALVEISEFNNVDLTHKHLFHQPYLHTRNNEKAARLAPLSKWHRVTLIAFILYIIVSSGIWGILTMELSQELGSVTSSSSKN